jgi:hypothetical protein
MRRAPFLTAVAGLLSLAAPAFAQSEELPSIRVDFSAVRAMPQRPPAGEGAFLAAPDAYGRLIHSIPLAPLLDAAHSPRTGFRSGRTFVRVFGGKSQNKKNWFVGFDAEGGETQFRNGRKMIHWALLNRTVHFTIDGRKYAAYLEGKVTDKMASRLTVQPEDRTESASSWTVGEMSDAAYEAALPVAVAGKEYRLFYTRDFNEDEHGEFAGYTGDRSITLLTREGGRLVGYHWFEREIPSDRVLVSAPKAVGADETRAGSLTVGLRLNAGALEIYSR